MILHGIQSLAESLQRARRLSELVRIQKPDGNFVVGVGREAIVAPEIGRDGGREVAHDAMNFFLRALVAGGGVVACEGRKILPKAVTWGKTVVPRLVDVSQGSPAVPSAHVFARGGQARALPKRLQKAVFIKGAVEGVVGSKLFMQGAFEEFNIAVAELFESGGDGGDAVRSGGEKALADQRSGAQGRASLQEMSAGAFHRAPSG